MTTAFDDWDVGDLIAAVADQDRVAFAELYRRTAPKLYAVVLRILGERSRAEDVMQDVFVRIWRSAPGYDAARGKPITWLATIARNLAIDRHRGDATRGRGRESEVELDSLSAGDGASAEALASLRICLDRLDPEQRAIVLAAYLGGTSREELAEQCGRPVGTIKSWLHRSLAQLKVCLGG